MQIFPDSTIILCSVPNAINPDYTNTITFKSEVERYNYFRSKAVKVLDKYSVVRQDDGIIRVEGESFNYLNINYLIFTNSNFSNKHFYAFIDSVRYINPNTTELHFTLDVMQTFFFTDCEFMSCMVEREHVDNDDPYNYKNSLPEGLDIGDYFCYQTSDYSGELGQRVVVIELSSKMPDKVTTDPVWIQNVEKGATVILEPGIYQGIYKANYVYIFSYTEDILNTVLPSIFNVLANTDGGQLDLIQGVYISFLGFAKRRNLMEDININLDKPVIVNGYIPRNNKLLMYPYNYMELNSTGETQQLKFELIQSDKINIKLSGYLEQGTPILMSVQNYQTLGNSFEVGVTTPGLPLVQYTTYDAINNWNQNINSRSMMLAYDMVGNTLNGISSVIGVGNSINPSNFQDTPGYIANKNYVNQGSQLGGIAGAASAGFSLSKSAVDMRRAYDMYMAQVQDVISRPPNTSYVNAIPNIYYTHGSLVPRIKYMSLNINYLRRIDAFFDRFGYKMMDFKIPNIFSRKNWNYLKLIDSDINTNINSEYLEEIKRILNAGITFWHTTDVGNYNLDNSIV